MGNMLKVGDSTVGLRGLDGALSELAGRYGSSGISPEKAAALLLERLEAMNYVPESARSAYLEALRVLWDRKVSGKCLGDDVNLQVRILGPGCEGCNRLERMVLDIFQENGIAADIEHVRELDEIWRYGVIATPALVLGDRVMSSGRIPARAVVEGWIKDFFSSRGRGA
jgi:small redox-active disulfide protein 2